MWNQSVVLLGEHRFDFRTDRDVEAREPDLRADEVDVQRVGERVDEAADQEERSELGEEGRRELLLDADEEAADGEDRGLPRVILRRLDALDPARAREAQFFDGAGRLGRAADLGLVAVGRERREALEGDDRQEDGVDG